MDFSVFKITQEMTSNLEPIVGPSSAKICLTTDRIYPYLRRLLSNAS